MQELRKAIIMFSVFFFLLSATGCNGGKKNKGFPDTPLYNLSRPTIIPLPELLDEISGLAYYPKDTSVFAIIDEEGYLFKIPLSHPKQIKMWQFDKSNDFEDIVLKDSTFYILVSNGNIETVRFTSDTDSILTDKYKFKEFFKEADEFESLWMDDENDRLILLCKDCETDGKKSVSSFSFNYRDTIPAYYQHSVLNALAIAAKLGKDKFHLRPSAATINPATKELYILSAIQHILVVATKEGEVKEVYPLNPAIYKQPEGIAFTPSGDMIISTERAEEGSASLLLLKNKQK